MNPSRPSEHPPVRGENAKTFRWDHRLQIVIRIYRRDMPKSSSVRFHAVGCFGRTPFETSKLYYTNTVHAGLLTSYNR